MLRQKRGSQEKSRNENTEMATLQFCSELDEVRPEMHACWL